MEAIIHANGKEFIEQYRDLLDNDITPEEWIDDLIETTFIHPEIDWWGSDATSLGMDAEVEPTVEQFLEMTEYLDNHCECEFDALRTVKESILYHYGYYMAKQCRDDWVNELK
jgi:hypothetical protein